MFFLLIAIFEIFKSKRHNMTTEKATKRENCEVSNCINEIGSCAIAL